MNRLVIIGNGFDLAHGLPTGYCDFIDWYWGKIIDNLKINTNSASSVDDGIVKIDFKFYVRTYLEEVTTLQKEILKIDSFKDLNSFVNQHSINEQMIFFSGDSGQRQRGDSCEIKFVNKFFEVINNKRSIQNWVDIENEYYSLLKDCLKEADNVKVKKLNEEFEQVKNLLKDYLYKNVELGFDFDDISDNYEKLLNLFQIKPLFLKNDLDHNYFREFSNDDFQDLVDFDNSLIQPYNEVTLQQNIDDGIIIQNNLVLNFNYTSTFRNYKDMSYRGSVVRNKFAYGPIWQIQIHGTLNDPSNAMNFGFGDEMDDDYKKIENKDDNEYLRNIKSFQYLQNSNYKEMLRFVESGKFQVYIMGHSCGLSDRILLNKIFEHHNCRSIKVFYHQFDEPKSDGRTDNFTEITQNISRHFNKKEMMREKIVNKSLCQPLPQNIRFTKKENSPQ